LENAKKAAFLTDAVVPQAELSGSLLTALNKAQLANRTYDILHQISDRDQGLRYMQEFSVYYDKAVKLSAAHPELRVLKEVLPDIEKAREAYMTHVKATEVNSVGLDNILNQLNNNSPITLTALNYLTADQDKKMKNEIAYGLAAEKIQERRQKMLFANNLLNKTNLIREIVYKSHSQLKPDLLETTTPLFQDIDELIQKLRPILYDPINQQQLDVVSQKITEYKEGVTALAQNLQAGQSTNGLRVAAGVELEKLIIRLDQKSTDRTMEYAQSSRSGLSLTAKMLITSMSTLVVLGLGAAFFIIRGVNRAKAEAQGKGNAGASQVLNKGHS
jgi:hypothetical protein